MRYHRTDPINVIWGKTIFGLCLALALFLWGWIKPEWHFAFYTQSVAFPARMLIWAMSFVLCVDVVIYACRSIWEWLD